MRALLSFVLASGLTAAALAESRPRTLFIMLDSVPFELVDEWMDPERPGGPILEGFQRPAPLISTFPSSTSVASVGLFAPLGLERSPGYEARFFDWSERRARGGGILSYFKIDFPWRHFFTWSKKGVVRSSVAALRPISASVGRAGKAIRAFLDSEEPDFYVYIETTDLVSHLKGPERLRSTFMELDRAIRQARRERPHEPFSVVLFADHGISGGERLHNVWHGVGRALRDAGYRRAQRLRGPRDVVLTPYGLVSSFEVYTQEESRKEVAGALAQVEGVELCVTPVRAAEVEGSGVSRRGESSVAPGDRRVGTRLASRRWLVLSPSASARIDLRSAGAQDEWSYEPEGGDPLRLLEALGSLRERTGDGDETWFTDRAWFDATASGQYPDPLYRLARAFDLVDNPASILCSVAEGHMYGLASAERTSRLTTGALRWTHGSLRWKPTVTFLTTDDPEWHPTGPLRFSEALRPLAAAKP